MHRRSVKAALFFMTVAAWPGGVAAQEPEKSPEAVAIAHMRELVESRDSDVDDVKIALRRIPGPDLRPSEHAGFSWQARWPDAVVRKLARAADARVVEDADREFTCPPGGWQRWHECTIGADLMLAVSEAKVRGNEGIVRIRMWVQNDLPENPDPRKGHVGVTTSEFLVTLIRTNGVWKATNQERVFNAG